MSRSSVVATVAAILGACLSVTASADGFGTLSDADLFQHVQKDVMAITSPAELDALNDLVATCSAVSLGQRDESFQCERAVKRYWARYNRGRGIDTFITAVGSLYEAFDNGGANVTEPMASAYHRMGVDLIALLRDINTRYGELDKR